MVVRNAQAPPTSLSSSGMDAAPTLPAEKSEALKLSGASQCRRFANSSGVESSNRRWALSGSNPTTASRGATGVDGRATTIGPWSVLATGISEPETENVSADGSFNSLECSPAPSELSLCHLLSTALLSTAATCTGELVTGGVIQRLGS